MAEESTLQKLHKAEEKIRELTKQNDGLFKRIEGLKSEKTRLEEENARLKEEVGLRRLTAGAEAKAEEILRESGDSAHLGDEMQRASAT